MHALARRFRRRQVLAGLAVSAVGLASACTSDKIVADPPHPGGGPQNPVEPFSLYLAAERRLRDSYAATIAKHPGLKPKLAALLAEHTEHVKALEAIVGESARPAPSGSASGTATPTRDAAAKAAIPATVGAAVAALRSAEQAAAKRFATACLAETGARAALLASVSAAEACHLVVL